MTFQSAAHLKIPTQTSGPVLELHGQRKVFTIPSGLKGLIEEMTRETIRNNPANIYAFLADLLEKKLRARDASEVVHGDEHSWQWRRWGWDGSSLLTNEELMALLSEYKLSLEEANQLATIIQAAYRGFLVRKESHPMIESYQKPKSQLWDEWRHEGNLYVSAKDVQDILAYNSISIFEANALATKVQQVFRDHLGREGLSAKNPDLEKRLKNKGSSQQCSDRSATRIQTVIRGYKARTANKEEKYNFRAQSEEETDTEYETAGEDGDNFAVQEHLEHLMKEKAGEMMEETEGEGDVSYQYQPGGKSGVKPDVLASRARVKPSPNPKYDAYFPGGYGNETLVLGAEGLEIPPKFTHQHFGDINPMEVRAKFLDTGFLNKMFSALKDLKEVKDERLKQIPPPGVQDRRKEISQVRVSHSRAQSQQRQLQPQASTDKSHRGSLPKAQTSAAQLQGRASPSIHQLSETLKDSSFDATADKPNRGTQESVQHQPEGSTDKFHRTSLPEAQTSVPSLHRRASLATHQIHANLKGSSFNAMADQPNPRIQQSAQPDGRTDKSHRESLPEAQLSLSELQEGSALSVDQLRQSLKSKSLNKKAHQSKLRIEKSDQPSKPAGQKSAELKNGQLSDMTIQ